MPWVKAPGTGIEPVAFWFRARRNYQQLLCAGQVMRRTERCWLSLCKLGEEDSNLYHLIQSDERAMLCRCGRAPFTQWTGRRSNPRLLLFRQALDRLSYRSVSSRWNESTKKARCRCDTGLCVVRKSTAERHKRNGCDGIFACS